jgi:hypothetical protein
MVDAADSTAVQSAGMQTMYYTQPNRQAPGGPEYTNDETTFAHDCNGDRITATNYPSHYLMEPSSTHLGQLWADEVNNVINNWHASYNVMYEDLSDTIIYTSASPCNWSQSEWTTASNNLDSFETATGTGLVYNGLAVLSKNGDGSDGVSPSIALNASATGGMFEGCYTTSGSFPLLHSDVWLATEDTEIEMAQQHKLFYCRGDDNTDAASSVGARLYQLASFLLTYGPNTSILGESFATPNSFHELPEQKLVAMQPLIATPSDISGLLQSGGAYGRQYAKCYIGGQYVGPCAVAVNISSTASASFPWPTRYHHALAIAGEDILDSGAVGTSGTLQTTMPEESGEIAFQ